MTAKHRPVDPPFDDTLYERDYVEWAEAQAEAVGRLRDLRPAADVGIDHDNLIDEILDMARSWRHAYESQIIQTMVHLLKLEHSPARDPRRHWRSEVTNRRLQARRRAAAAPSLRSRIDLRDLYADARKLALIALEQDAVPASTLPATCPYDLDTQILADGWFPGNRHGLLP
jgi:hypothetical protein